MAVRKTEWVTGSIGDSCLVGDGAHARISRQGNGVLYLTSRNFKDGGLDSSKVAFISEQDFSKHFRKESKALTRPKAGDVVFSIIGTIGEPYLVRPEDRFGISSSVAILRPDVNVVAPRYLFYWVKGRLFQDALYGIKGGVAQGYVSLEMIRSLPLNCPDLLTQRKIAGVLAAYDDLIENNTRRIAILEEMEQLIYREWFVQFRFPGHESVRMVDSELGPIPEGWEVKPFSDVFNIKYGKTLPRKKMLENARYPVYGAGGVIGYYDKCVSEDKVSLVTCRGNGSGTVWRTREAAFITNNSLIVAPFDDFSSWEYFFVEKLLKHSNIAGVISGSAQPQITIEGLSTVQTLVPPETSISLFCELARPINELIDLLESKNSSLRDARDLLLPRLVSGEVDVSELEIDTGGFVQ